ncbi:MAG: GGDEF domain-containing protein [bacterium]|nr:GGDEF domain-containing protein [bacterium]
MSENVNNNIRIKISSNLGIQKKVEERESLIKRISPQLDDKTRNQFARHETARNLKLDKRAGETARAKELSLIDDLTKLHNKRWLGERLEMKIAEAKRKGRSFKVIGFDIDHFKWINDTYGHNVGDLILKAVKSVPARTEEPICRDGGEEFKQILDAENGDDIQILTSRLMESMENLSAEILKDKKIFPNIPNQEIPEILKKITLSVGVTKYIPGMSAEDLIAAVDAAQYYAKQNGRNKAVYTSRISQGNNYDYRELQRKPATRAIAQ